MAEQRTTGNLDGSSGACVVPTVVPSAGKPLAWLMKSRELRRQLFDGSVNRRIFSAAMVVGALTLFAKTAGMAKEVLVAAWFGTGDALDAFLVAFLMPAYAINVIAGSINAALIPTFVEVREKEGNEAAQRLFSGSLVFSIALLTLSVLVLAAVAPVLLPLLCSGFSPAKVRLTLELFYVLLPGILIAGVAMSCEAALNAGERFALAAIAPSAVPVMIMAALAVAGARIGIDAPWHAGRLRGRIRGGGI